NLNRDEVQTGKRVLLAYGIQFMNQMGRISLVAQYNVGLDPKLGLLLGGVIQVMFVIGETLDSLHQMPPLMSLRVLLSDFLFGPVRPSNPMMWVFVRPIQLHDDDDRYSALVQGQAIGISTNWLWNIFVAMITPTLIENLA
ncbi:uncharacterized protein N7477_000438, partial [Penicillium maclennaniae]|uniref:uncharacterized protein n=1 Tax=Penicillium maclennaniae TaxID=1343394 RepID=UPI0025401249